MISFKLKVTLTGFVTICGKNAFLPYIGYPPGKTRKLRKMTKNEIFGFQKGLKDLKKLSHFGSHKVTISLPPLP